VNFGNVSHAALIEKGCDFSAADRNPSKQCSGVAAALTAGQPTKIL
jgi:hypothetical protein